MAASIHPIPLPAPPDDDESLTWDQSIADIPCLDHDEEINSIANRNSLTFHAVAHGRCVIGTSPSLPNNDHDTILWQTKFDNEVVALASNNDGSVIASATKTHVSLMKGRDGSILATRQIVSDRTRNSSSLPGVVFVSRPASLVVPDVLVVFRPADDSVENGRSDIILISNIHGPTLNSPHLNRVREAAQEMSIDALTIPSLMNISSIVGVYVDEETIRFFLSGKGKLGVYDYNIKEKKSALVLEDLSELMPGGWRCNDAIEMCIDDNTDIGTYLLFVACMEDEQSKICWINVLNLSLAAQYMSDAGITSLKAVRSSLADKCAAAVFATEGTNPKIHVVQSLVSEDGKACKESDSMILFTIDGKSQYHSLELASPITTEEKGPYSFRFISKRKSDGENTACAEFVSGDQGQAGVVHYLLANNSFDEAYKCVNDQLNQYSCNNSMVLSSVNKSLVALWQFRSVLSKGNISSKENIIEAKECLRRLAASAIRGGDQGVDDIVNASHFLMNWPKNQTTNEGECSSDFKTITVQEVCMALSAMSTTITSVLEVLNASKIGNLEETKRKLDDRQAALRALRSISEVDGLQLTLADPYLAIGSLADLINSLVSHGAFKSVERLMKSEWGKRIPFNVVASSVLRIPLCVDPRCFLFWLCDLVLPSLSIGDPLLESIRAWACGAADKYDDENVSFGLDHAIILLQAISKATARLSVAMNKSFAHKLQLETERHDPDEAMTPRHNGTFFSFDSKASARSFHSRPTVLNVGMISGMKTTGQKVFSAKRKGRSPELSPVSQDVSFFSSSSAVDYPIEVDEDLGDDCVEDKLNNAIRLKAARSFGMERECLTLANYSSYGEQYIVKELVKVSLKQVVNSGDDFEEIANKIRSYAIEVSADFDDAVHQYAVELCDSSREHISSILKQTEMLSRWCSSPAVRCLIILKMLRKALVSVQQPPDLSGLASEALSWATDGNIKSELEEALRLLSIDSLVRKYCGNGAQEFFRVNEASHSIRLVEHVCRHIDVDDVLIDILALCDAFNTSVSKIDTCVSLIQRVMIAPPRSVNGHELSRTEHAVAIMHDLYSRDCVLGERVGERVTIFCQEILEDARRLSLKNMFTAEAKRQAFLASSTACAILSIMKNYSMRRKPQNIGTKIPTTLKEFQRISRLMAGCDIFITLAELRNPSSCASVLVDLLKPCVELLQQRSFKLEDGSLREKLKPMLASAKHWCAILCDTPSQVSELWSRAVGTVASYIAKITENGASLLLLEVSGVLDERSGQSSFHSVISVALTLCGLASAEASKLSKSSLNMSKDRGDLSQSLNAMKNMSQASLLLREHIILLSPPSMLPSSITLANITEFVCEVSCRADLGIGENIEKYMDLLQVGSRMHQRHLTRSPGLLSEMHRPSSAPVLHPTWYIGDGLLLPPVETLLLSMTSCKMILDFESHKSSELGYFAYSLMKVPDIIHILEARGAHSTSLRLISFCESVALSQSISSLPFSHSSVRKICAALAERSLGGMESGLTSGDIDAMLSISFLIGNLPKEKAFNIYQSALPSAIGKRDFSRILTLAAIGAYCGVGNFSSGEPFPWNKQVKFVEQCFGFATHAKMWCILSRYRTSFDPATFTQANETSSSSLQGYCEQLIWNAAKHLDPQTTLCLGMKFAKQYSLSKYLPASVLIEFLLSSPNKSGNEITATSNDVDLHDIRRDLSRVEVTVRRVCLPMLPIVHQSKVLRKCIMLLEKPSAQCGADYDRHAMVLTLYKECIDKLSGLMTSETRQKAHAQESARIERRLNAIILLASIFGEKYPEHKKPDYTKLFEPLPSDPSILSTQNQRKLNVLGYDSFKNIFDPLAALHDVLEDHTEHAMAASLSPLCNLLGLPSGYIHARALFVRFRKMKQIGEALPSAESAVFPVVKKLVIASDRADLAWWCSLQYNNGSSDKLKCIDLAYINATIASEQVESNGTQINAEEERNALDRVKKIDLARAMLSDQIIVNDVLARNQSFSAIVTSVYRDIIQRVQVVLHTNDDYMPERLVKELLVEGSMAAALASLDENNTFTTSHFRSLAILVHDACRLLSTRYSHINIGRSARIVTHRWLVHGDEMTTASAADASESTNNDEQPSSNGVLQASTDLGIGGENDVTSEFIMDIGSMNMSSGNHLWDEKGSLTEKTSGIKSSDEPSVFGRLSSQRESSDHQVNRVALRIAFLMCFAEGYHQHDAELSGDDQDENADANIAKRTNLKPKAKLHKVAYQKASCFEGDLALAHAKELLGIVFAKQGCTVASTFAFILDESNERSYFMHREDACAKSKALSFAMRHRALRVASILCPQDILVRVILEEGYSSDFDDDHLEKIAFGSFLAMEIEAMGLSLPHSDLAQLSTMHFPSYARTLWRNHGGTASSRLCGRLHLLLLELSMNHCDTVDWDLLVLMFREISKSNLPRSLLLACECVIQTKAVELAASSNRQDVMQCISDAMKKIFELLSLEIRGSILSAQLNAAECLSTVDRFVFIIDNLSSPDIIYFVDAFTALASYCREQCNTELYEMFMSAAVRTVSHLTDPLSFSKAAPAITYETGFVWCGPSSENPEESICLESIQSYEKTFAYFLK